MDVPCYLAGIDGVKAICSNDNLLVSFQTKYISKDTHKIYKKKKKKKKKEKKKYTMFAI